MANIATVIFTIIFLMQAQSMVQYKLLSTRQEVKDCLERGILPAVTSDIWTSGGKDFISFTLHYCDFNGILNEINLGAIPFPGN